MEPNDKGLTTSYRAFYCHNVVMMPNTFPNARHCLIVRVQSRRRLSDLFLTSQAVPKLLRLKTSYIPDTFIKNEMKYERI